MKKVLIFIVAIVMVVGVLVFLPKTTTACGFFSPCDSTYSTELQKLDENQKKLIQSVPVPPLSTSQERLNISKRAQLFDSENKISYIYFVSYGKVMAFYTVKGKVSSLRSYMVPQQKLINYDGTPCGTGTHSGTGCYTVDAPDVDGSYGDNADGIFFFTTEGAYVEWKGDYMMSDQPLQMATQPELVRQIR
jgi:hypothetical protein